MGLDIVPVIEQHDARVSTSYGGFKEFREEVAKLIGIDLPSMQGFGGVGNWPSPGEEPLVHLLHHSDCDGELSWHQCDELAPRLRFILPRLPEGWLREYGERLTDLVERVKNDEFSFLVFA